MDFNDWDRRVLSPFAGDPVWRATAFRLAIYLLDESWLDTQRLQRYPVLRPVSGQLYRAIGSIGSNFAEGYSRSSGKDRVRLFEYALGSTREAQVWYYASRHVLEAGDFDARFATLRRIGQLITASLPRERRRNISRTEE